MKKIFIGHNSCFNSSYDLNIVKEALRRRGYDIVNDPRDADEIMFSGCAAHATWVSDAISQITQIAGLNRDKKLIVTGCISGIDANKVRAEVNSNNLSFQSYKEIVDTYTELDFDEVDRQYAQDDSIDFEGEGEFNQLRQRVGQEKLRVIFELDKVDREFGTDLVRFYKSITKGFVFYHEDEPVEFITVSRSCLYKCSFCAIPKGRGAYTSVPLGDIIQKAKGALSKGINRITLIGDEVGNYGVDIGNAGMGDLVEELLALDENLQLGIRYIEPTPFLRYYDVLKKYCDEGRIYLLYVPLQTGSQKILRDMKRNYDLTKISEKYRSLIDTTNTVLFCNWMVGFPTETESDFMQTVNLARTINFQISSAIPYSERPGTQSPLLREKVPDEVIAERLARLRSVLVELKLERFQKLLDFLEPARRSRVLELIEIAEAVNISETPNQPVSSAPALVQLKR